MTATGASTQRPNARAPDSAMAATRRKSAGRIAEAVTGHATIAIDLTVEAGAWPPETELAGLARRAVDAVMASIGATSEIASELSLVFSDDARLKVLNAGWRGKDKPTNVLSFPAFPHSRRGAVPPMLGDVVLAAETVAAEARAEGKPLDHHIVHLIVHGVLHLIGYDHETDAEAEEMEETERRILAGLDIPDPYR
jgi:probable rRNA maturation factor